MSAELSPYRSQPAEAQGPDLTRSWLQSFLVWVAPSGVAESPIFRRLCGGRWWKGPLLVEGPSYRLTVNPVGGPTDWQRDPIILQGLTPGDLADRRGSVLWLLDMTEDRWRPGPQCPHRWRYGVRAGTEMGPQLPPQRCTCELYPRAPGLVSAAALHNAVFALLLALQGASLIRLLFQLH